MRTSIIGIALATMLSSTAVVAQERAPFTGPHVDAVAGADRVQGGGEHDDGLAFGGAAGWDFDLGRFRAGAEAEITGSTQRECVTGATAGNSICAEAGRDLYVGTRLGALVGPATLLYIKAGYTNARFSAKSSTAAGASDNLSTNLDGVRVGAGVEHMLNRNVGLKAEYRYSNFEAGGERHQLIGGVSWHF